MIQKRNLDKSLINWIVSESGLGPGIGDVKYVATATSATNQYRSWLEQNGVKSGSIYTTPTLAEASLTAYRNDVVVVMPGTYTLTSLLTWDRNNTHIIGSHSASPWSNNVIIRHTASTATSPWLTFSGNDCLIKNIHFISGGSNAAQHYNIKNTGSGNMYENCWFEGPTNATQGTDTDVNNVLIDGGGNYFRNCIFGTTAHNTMNGAAQVGWTGSAYRSTFENCLFFMSVAATAGRMLDCGKSSSDISGPQFFRNCQFSAWYSGHSDQCSALVYDNNKAGTGQLIFDPNCMFVGFDKIVTGGSSQAATYCGHPLTAAHDGTVAGLIERQTGSNP